MRVLRLTIPAAVLIGKYWIVPAVVRHLASAAVREQWEATTRPMAELYVVPSAKHASITVEGTDALDWPVEQILKRLREDGLIPPITPGRERNA